MTKIRIIRQSQDILGFECSSHSGYKEEGSDIVCAAISTLTQTCALGLQNVQNQKVSINRNDKKAYLKVELKSKDENQIQNAQVLFKTMLLGLKEIESAYKKYLKLEDDYEII